MTETINYHAEYSLLPLTPEFSFVEGDVFKLGLGDVISSGDGFDSLIFQLALNGVSLIDEVFETLGQFSAFFEDDIFQYVLGEDEINAMTGFSGAQALSVNLMYQSSPDEPVISTLEARVANVLFEEAGISMNAFGFNLFAAEGDSFFVAMDGGPGDPTSEVPVPAAFWFMASGLLMMLRKKRSAD